jgi:predicted PurR-regulated permease PerM
VVVENRRCGAGGGTWIGVASTLGVVVTPLLLGLLLAAATAPLFERLWTTRLAAFGASLMCSLLFVVGMALFLWLAFRAVVAPWPDIVRELSKAADDIGR